MIPNAKSKKHEFVKLTKFDDKWILSHGDIRYTFLARQHSNRNNVLISKVMELTESNFEGSLVDFNVNLFNVILKTMKPFNKEQGFTIHKNDKDTLKIVIEDKNILFTQVLSYNVK